MVKEVKLRLVERLKNSDFISETKNGGTKSK